MSRKSERMDSETMGLSLDACVVEVKYLSARYLTGKVKVESIHHIMDFNPSIN